MWLSMASCFNDQKSCASIKNELHVENMITILDYIVNIIEGGGGTT